jgi:hypothetical protein
MESVQIHRLGSDDFTWADQIAAAVATAPVTAPSPGEGSYQDINNASTSGHEFFGIEKNVPEGDPLSGSEA